MCKRLTLRQNNIQLFVWSDDGLCPKLYHQHISIFAYFFIEEKVIYLNLSTNIYHVPRQSATQRFSNRIALKCYTMGLFQRPQPDYVEDDFPPPGVPAPLPKSVDPPPTSTGGGKSQPLAEQVRAGRRQLWRSKYKLL